MSETPRKLHVGCGPCYLDGFINIDLREDVKTDYCGSLFDFVMGDSTADFIWSCHMLEHLDYPADVNKCLARFHGWLKPGGVLRLAVPDLRKVAEMYVNRDPDLFELFGDMDPGYAVKGSAAERFMFFCRGWEHTILFDFNLLAHLLGQAGFGDIRQCKPGESRTGHWPHDRMELESLYVEATK